MHRRTAFPRTGELVDTSFELFEVKGRQTFEAFGTIHGEMESDNAMVFFVSTDETCGVNVPRH